MTFQCLCVERSTELGVLRAELGLGLTLEGVYVLSAYWQIAFRQLAIQWRIRTAHRNVSAMATCAEVSMRCGEPRIRGFGQGF